VALVFSFVIKRDSEVVDYEDAFGAMKTVDDVNVNGSSVYGTVILWLLFISDC